MTQEIQKIQNGFKVLDPQKRNGSTRLIPQKGECGTPKIPNGLTELLRIFTNGLTEYSENSEWVATIMRHLKKEETYGNKH